MRKEVEVLRGVAPEGEGGDWVPVCERVLDGLDDPAAVDDLGGVLGLGELHELGGGEGLDAVPGWGRVGGVGERRGG